HLLTVRVDNVVVDDEAGRADEGTPRDDQRKRKSHRHNQGKLPHGGPKRPLDFHGEIPLLRPPLERRPSLARNPRCCQGTFTVPRPRPQLAKVVATLIRPAASWVAPGWSCP